MAVIAVLGTLDSKGHEHEFVAQRLRSHGHVPMLIDVGSYGSPQITPHVTRETVAACGRADWADVLARRDRGECVAMMADAAAKCLSDLCAKGRIAGVISLGGGGGTAIATAAMRALPIGFPKLMVSTLASGYTAHYVGKKDITMMPSIVDFAGLNRISRTILSRAAGAISGMVEATLDEGEERPIIVASMFGNTTDCVNHAVKELEGAGYEVLVFHATGSGGRTMESLIESGIVAGVLDITTTEWADELVGGSLSAGPYRLEAAGKAGVPSVVVPGCLDMVNFGERASVPTKFADRKFYQHNPQVTLMRTTPSENQELGRILAEKCNAYTAPCTVLLPLRAISVISAPGGVFHDAAADQALFDSLREHLRPKIQVEELETEINSQEFAHACVQALLRNMKAAAGQI